MFIAKFLVSNRKFVVSNFHNLLMNKSSEFFYIQRRTSQSYESVIQNHSLHAIKIVARIFVFV